MPLSADNVVTRYRYRYGKRNLLVELTDPDGDVERFAYDALRRRSELRQATPIAILPPGALKP